MDEKNKSSDLRRLNYQKSLELEKETEKNKKMVLESFNYGGFSKGSIITLELNGRNIYYKGI